MRLTSERLSSINKLVLKLKEALDATPDGHDDDWLQLLDDLDDTIREYIDVE